MEMKILSGDPLHLGPEIGSDFFTKPLIFTLSNFHLSRFAFPKMRIRCMLTHLFLFIFKDCRHFSHYFKTIRAAPPAPLFFMLVREVIIVFRFPQQCDRNSFYCEQESVCKS